MEQKKTQKWIELACPGLETPILTGKDARRFLKKMKEVRPSSEERERVRRISKMVTWEI